jgi:hypothetical protein
MRAIDVIQDAYERLNRLSPGETLNADDAAFGFRRLNLLVDAWSARQEFLYKSVLTSAAQTGNITLAAGSWAAIPAGADILSINVDGADITKMTMLQYSGLYSPTATGSPVLWAHDGLSTVYLSPVATGQTIQILTRTGVATFADQTTTYTATPGYQDALGAALAVRLAPTVLGKLPGELVRAERAAMMGVMSFTPAVLDVYGYTDSAQQTGTIANGYQ